MLEKTGQLSQKTLARPSVFVLMRWRTEESIIIGKNDTNESDGQVASQKEQRIEIRSVLRGALTSVLVYLRSSSVDGHLFYIMGRKTTQLLCPGKGTETSDFRRIKQRPFVRR